VKKIVDPNLLAKLEGKQPAPTPTPKIKTQPKEVTDSELLQKLEADNKRLTTVNELLNNAIDVKIIEVPKRVEVPKIVEKEVIKEVPVEKIVEKIVEKPVEKIVEKPVEKIVHKYVEVPVAIQQPKQNVKRESVDKVTIKNNKINRVATLKKLDDLLN
jgi:OOP family OmpA-OmpF porin